MGNAFDELLSGYNHPNRCSDRVDGQRESGINRNTDASVPKINWTRRSLELVNSGYLVEMFTHDNKLIAQPWRVYLESGCRDAIPHSLLCSVFYFETSTRSCIFLWARLTPVSAAERRNVRITTASCGVCNHTAAPNCAHSCRTLFNHGSVCY